MGRSAWPRSDPPKNDSGSNMNDSGSIRFYCPHCAKRLRVDATAAGKRIRCPTCTKPVTVPTESTIVEAADLEPAAPPPAAPPAPPPGRLWRWLLRLSLTAVVALIFGGVGFLVADAGFKRETSF